MTTYLDELDIVLIGALGRYMILPTGGELVFRVGGDGAVVEVGQNVQETSSVPVISHPPSVVTLTRQVRDGVKWNLLVLINEHLQLSDADTQV